MATNGSSKPLMFLLTGFPGLENIHPWIAISISLMYLVAICGNCTILAIIQAEVSLHKPMYLFLAMLAVTDLCLAATTLPTMLRLFWFNSRAVSFDACATQMFFIHSLSCVESGILVAMAFDRFVAISNPLRYSLILTNSRIAKTGLAMVFRAVLFTLPTPILLRLLRYCRVNTLSHSFCVHQDMMKLACSDRRVNIIYGLFAVLATFGIDSLLILLSYVIIVKTVFNIASGEERLRALDTCVSHLCAVLIFYIPLIGLTIVHRFGEHASPLVHILMGFIYVLIPPMLNPIVYSIKITQIRQRILKRLQSSPALCAR
ncbi:olfactory receptor 51G1-like [Apteryx mantelli]|uniref:Olfactory receptor n=1 Tax=Apteryx mantelli TaxID=2696672 RepID=A0ABM4DYT4_9AVES